MPESKPHWRIKFKHVYRQRNTKTYQMNCMLWRAPHINAPLVEYARLTDTFSSYIADTPETEMKRREFWAAVRVALRGIPEINTEYMEKLERQIDAVVPRPVPSAIDAALEAGVITRRLPKGQPVARPIWSDLTREPIRRKKE